MIYGSVCSGIEAASLAWHPLGWRPAFFSEVDPFPRAVLVHHYPGVPLHGDFTTINAGNYDAIDLLVGGTPCQSFSIAGLRGGLGDDRGNLALEFLRLADRLRPDWLVWENVPGVLSSGSGRDFGSILGGMVELGYGFAYRVLDAQYVRTFAFPWAVPQRRRRVFVVGYLGDWRRAASVLFDASSLRGDPAPCRKAGQTVAPTISARTSGGGGLGTDFDLDGGLVANSGQVSHCLTASAQNSLDAEPETLIAFDPQQITSRQSRSNPKPGDACCTLPATSPAMAVAIQERAVSGGASRSFVAGPWSVRRLMPVECERLQGFPDGYTDIPWRGKETAPDGRRYKALGNSMAVNVMQWIGERIDLVNSLEL